MSVIASALSLEAIIAKVRNDSATTIAAAAAHQWQAAEDYFRTALHQAETVPHRLRQAEIRRFHAMMLMDRAAQGDREKARTLLVEALQNYQHIGMPCHGQIKQALLD
jgi:hypothetical protein